MKQKIEALATKANSAVFQRSASEDQEERPLAVDSDDEEKEFSDYVGPTCGTQDAPDEKKLVALVDEICLWPCAGPQPF